MPDTPSLDENDDDEQLARAALRAILADQDAPAAAKASAARTLAEMAGAIGRFAQPDLGERAPFQMTPDELHAELHRLSTEYPSKS